MNDVCATERSTLIPREMDGLPPQFKLKGDAQEERSWWGPELGRWSIEIAHYLSCSVSVCVF